jgi:NADH-quinone oxidoreductase subunit N
MTISIPSVSLTAIAPQLIVLATALLVLLVDLVLARQRKDLLAWLSLLGVLAAGAVTLIWDEPAGLQRMFVADGYSRFLNLVFLTATALALLFSLDYVERMGLARGEYYSLLLLSAAGMMLMGAAIHLMTIFVTLEILSIALYALVGLDRQRLRSGEAALKYFVLGAFASGFLLYGMALAYGATGVTDLAGLREAVAQAGAEPLLVVSLGLMLVGFAFKVALVPFQMWTPDVYHGAPTSVTAFMSVGAKAAGFAALGRLALYAFGDLWLDWLWVLGVLAVLTMSLGNLAALVQTNLKRMLAYSSIAHAGYILVGLTAGNALGVSGVLFYLFVYAFMNVGAFAVVIAAGRLGGSGETLDDVAGLARRAPGLGAAMTLFLLSLAGVPPLAGFLGKLYVFSAAIQADLAWLAIAGVVNSVISAYFYLRVVAAITLRDPASDAEARVCPALGVGLGLASVAVVLLGLWPAPILDLARATVSALLGG